jgi:1,4-dihydroxy-6-naphthoate synthase
MNSLSLGFSPCPNDTFIFYGLVHGKVTIPGVDFSPPCLEDVETLNSWAMVKRLDVTKLSFHALGHVLDEYCLLSAGSALGRGCGPLLVAKSGIEIDSIRRVAIPGKFTTAAMLFRMYAPDCNDLVEMRFDHIMGAIDAGEVDAGVIIHESRFTYEQQGFIGLLDLGQWWEDLSGVPIPLGCIAAKRSLGSERIAAIDRAIKESLQMSFDSPELSLPYIQEHSQELAKSVIDDHVGLYVNDYSLELGREGMGAIKAFLEKGRAVGILPKWKGEVSY